VNKWRAILPSCIVAMQQGHWCRARSFLRSYGRVLIHVPFGYFAFDAILVQPTN